MNSSGLVISGFLTGGGEMGKLIRSKDWSGSPLGTPETWPISLHFTLSILLNSKLPMFLCWGPESSLFYNDAFRPVLGMNGKQIDIPGMPAKKAWPEKWESIRPFIDQVFFKKLVSFV